MVENQIEFFNKNGYLVIKDLITCEECDATVEIFENYSDENYSPIINLDREVPEIRALMKHPRLVETLELIQQTEMMGLQTVFHYKKAGSPYAGQKWSIHQDGSYYPGMEYGVNIASDITFENQNSENGCLFIYPGSHIEPILPFKQVRSYSSEKIILNPGNHILSIPDKYRRIDLLLKKGSALILHSNLIHGSYPNLSNRSRPMLLMSYIKKGAYFPAGNYAERAEIALR